MRILICYITAVSMLVSSLAQAQLAGVARTVVETVGESAEVIAKEGAKTALAEELAQMGAKTATQEFTIEGELAYKFLDKEGKVIREFIAPKASAEMLEAAKPSKLFESLKSLSNQAKSHAGTAAKVTAAATLSQLKKFPIEAFTFFVALGAISTQDLIHNYSGNPAAYDELIEGQKDPITQIGFAAFMMANAASTQPLAAIFKSPKLHASLPYLGMSIGMVASSIVGEVGHIPGLKECALSFKFNKQACDQAYESWQKFSFANKGMKLMPGLAAMLATTLLMGAVQTVGYKLIMFAAKQSVAVAAKVLAFNILISCNEAGWVVRGVQIAFWGWQVLQLAGFIDTSNYLEIPLTHIWNNTVMVGPSLAKSRDRILDAAMTGNMNDVSKSLTKFSEMMDEWRQNNSLDVLTAHSHWINFLSQLSAEYNVSKIFYANLLNDLWLTKYHQNMPDHAEIMRLFPLYGVNNPSFQKIPAAKYFALRGMQESIEEDQVQTMNKVAGLIQAYAQNKTQEFHKMQPEEQNLIVELHSDFASNDIQKMGAGLIKLNQSLGVSGLPTPTFFGWGGHSDTYLSFAKSLREIIGDPRPMMSPGAGYLHALDEYYKEQGLIDPFPKNTNTVATPTATEAMIYLMFSGPDADHDKLIDTTWTGFKAHFLPPKIVSNLMVDYTMPPPRGASAATYQPPDIFKMWYGLDPRMFHPAEYQSNLFDGLVNKAQIPSDILGDNNGPKSEQWWAQKVEPQYINAWIDFESKYQDIVLKLYKDLWKPKKDLTNFTSFANGIVASTRQELDVYMELLSALSPKYREFKAIKTTLNQSENDLENLLRGIQLKTNQSVDLKTGQAVLVSRISNSELDATEQSFSEQLKSYTDQLLASPANANQARQEVIKTLTEKMNHSFSALVDYGKIVNDVSYKERYSLGTDSGAKCIQPVNGVTTAEMLKGALQNCRPYVPPQSNNKPAPISNSNKPTVQVTQQQPETSTWQSFKNWCWSWFDSSNSNVNSRTAGAQK